MNRLFLVFFGGGLGALARYYVGVLTFRTLGPGWPYGTFTVNVAGGFVMGLLTGWLAHRGGANQDHLRLLLAVGVLGGFTTFSSFSLETALMLERRDYATAAGYILGSVVLSVAALFAGLLMARRAFA
jgi:CrcB protein